MKNSRPLTVELLYDNGSKKQYSFPQHIECTAGVVGGEWVRLPNDLTDEEAKWVFDEVAKTAYSYSGDY